MEGNEKRGAALLAAATVVALVWANSPVGSSYEDLWGHDVRHWVNDWLMAVFFFLVGVEVRREVTVGALRDRRAAVVPIVAAVGGMVVPALIYTAVNAGGPGAAGWGIVMATDIAFVVGAVALLGDRCPPGVRAFLLTLAVVDDIGAVAVIAVFYSGGVHPTIIAVLLGLALPLVASRPFERLLTPWSVFVVVPVFALANAGVSLGGASFTTVTFGVIAGLVVGKTVGIAVSSLAVVRLGGGMLPEGMGAAHLGAAGALAGIGFTVSLFVTELAFSDAALRDQAKLGVLVASSIAAVVGYAWFRVLARRTA